MSNSPVSVSFFDFPHDKERISSSLVKLVIWPVFSILAAYVIVGALLVNDCPDSSVMNVAFVPNSEIALVRRSNGEIEVWNTMTGQNIQKGLFSEAPQCDTLPTDFSTQPPCLPDNPPFFPLGPVPWGMAVSPDGRFVATAYGGGSVVLWRLDGSEPQQVFIGQTGLVQGIAFSPDGSQLLTGSTDKTVRLWNVSTGAQLRIFNGHTSEVSSVAFSPNGGQILSGSYDDTARLWDVETGELLQVFHGSEEWVETVSFSPDSNTVAIGSWDSRTRLWDAQTDALISTFREPVSGGVDVTMFSSDGELILTAGSWDSDARLWNVATGEIVRSFSGHSDWIFTADLSPDSRYVLTGSIDHSARIWDAQTGSQLYVLCPSFFTIPWFASLSIVIAGIAITGNRLLGRHKNIPPQTEVSLRQYRRFALLSFSLSFYGFAAFYLRYVLPNFYDVSSNYLTISYLAFFFWSMGAATMFAYYRYQLQRFTRPQRSGMRLYLSLAVVVLLAIILVMFWLFVAFALQPIP